MFDIVVITDKGKTTNRVRCNIKHATIGKSRDNLVQIRGWRIAPSHCRVEMTDKGIFVEDTSEGIGTLVNGEKVTYYGPIRSADVISIGNYEFRIGAVAGEDVEEKPLPQGEKEDLKDKNWAMETFVGQAIKADTPEQKEESLSRQRLYMWRNRIHQEVLRMMDLRRTDVGGMDEDELRVRVEEMIAEVMRTLGSQLPDDIDQERLKIEVLNEAVGLGPLEDLIADDDVTEIMVNAYDDIYIEKSGKLTKSPIAFSSDAAVMSAIERIVSPLGWVSSFWT